MEQLEKKKSKKKGCLIVIIAILGILMILGIIAEKNHQSSDTTNTTYNDYKDLSTEFQVLSEDEVESYLKYPDGWEYERSKITRKDSTLYSLNAIVLANNAYGVRTRLNCILQMRFIGTKKESRLNGVDRSKWAVERIDIE